MDVTRSTGASGARGPARLAPGTLVADRFEVLGVAGSGGMGTVYKVRDRTSGTPCALKVMRGDGGDQDRFQREAEILSKVQHPHVVGYVAHGCTAEGDPYLAMDWLDGEALKDFLEKRMLTPREGAELGQAIASALGAAHAKGVIHRDLKPSNLVLGAVTPVESVKVLDFGVARLRDFAAGGPRGPSAELDRDLTRTGQVIGTPGYMAPEQARGEKDVDERADLFSLGCVLYRCIAGRPAFEGDDVLAVLTLLVLHDPPRVGDLVDGVPDALDELIAKLLEKDRSRRPESAAVVSAELAKIAALPDAAYQRTARGVADPVKRNNEHETATGLGRTVPDLASASSRTGSRGAKPIVAAPDRSRPTVFAGAAAALAIGGGIVAAIVLTRPSEPNKRTASASASSAPSAPIVQPHASPEEVSREAAQRCRVWGPALTHMRDAAGSFGLEAQRTPGGWETGQAVMAWATGARACSFDTSEHLPEALAAIEKLKRRTGWGSSDKELPTQGFSGGIGWVLLGLVAANAASPSADLQQRAAEARAMLLPLQNPTGTYRFHTDSKPNTEEDYSTMIATWALVESAWLEPIVPAKDARSRGVDALRSYLMNRGGDPPVETVDGYEEQMAWIILLDRHKGGLQPSTDCEMFEKVAKDVLGRCDDQAPPGADTACINPALSANSHLAPDPNGREYFHTFWLPWAALLSNELSRDTTVSLSPETRAKLAGVARWTLGELLKANPASMTAVYQVAEYLFAVSRFATATEPTVVLDESVHAPVLPKAAPSKRPDYEF